MNLEIIFNIIISIITCLATIISVVIAVIALVQTKKQVELSNKQNLFNERVRIFLFINGLLELYVKNRGSLTEDKEDRIYVEVDWLFCSMVNNAYLENISAAIYKPLQNPEQKELLKKIEEIRNEAIKSQFLFDGDIAKLLHNFITNYADILMALYQYKVLLEDMREMTGKIPQKDINDVAKEVKEIQDREELFEKMEKLEKSYKKLEEYKVKDVLENQIRLIK